jgi:hypothetical protein
MLEIDEVQVKVNGKKDTLSSPGTVDEDAELGDEIELKITVKNNFAVDNTSTVIRNIDMEISSDIDEADGLDESISRLNAGDDDEMTISFVIDPSSVLPSDAPFDITIDVEGTTTDGTVHRDSWTISLDMDTKSRDLYILSAEATPLTFNSCQENRIRVDFDVRNIGSRDLDDAAVRLKVSSLGINKIVSGIELDSGDDDQYSDYVTIPAGVAPGTYSLDVDAYPQKTVNTVTSMSAFEFEVLECTTGIVNPSTPGNVNPITPSNPGTVNVPNVTISGTPVSSAVGNKNIFNADNTLYLVLLGVLVVLLVTVIVLLAVKIKN